MNTITNCITDEICNTLCIRCMYICGYLNLHVQIKMKYNIV